MRGKHSLPKSVSNFRYAMWCHPLIFGSCAGFFSLKSMIAQLVVVLVILILSGVWILYWSLWRVPAQQKARLLASSISGASDAATTTASSRHLALSRQNSSTDVAASMGVPPSLLWDEDGSGLGGNSSQLGRRRHDVATMSVTQVENSYRCAAFSLFPFSLSLFPFLCLFPALLCSAAAFFYHRFFIGKSHSMVVFVWYVCSTHERYECVDVPRTEWRILSHALADTPPCALRMPRKSFCPRRIACTACCTLLAPLPPPRGVPPSTPFRETIRCKCRRGDSRTCRCWREQRKRVGRSDIPPHACT